jgi:hypothetical protein
VTPDEVRTGVSRLSVVERMAVEEAVLFGLAAAFTDEFRRQEPEKARVADAEAARLIKSGYLETPEGKAKMQEALLALARAGSE